MQDRKYTGLIILAVLVVLLNLPLPASMRLKAFSRENIGPFQSAATLIFYKVREGARIVFRAREALKQREALVAEIAQLRQQVRRLEYLQRDNTVLRDSLGFRQQSRRNLIMCEVVVRRDTTGWWQTLTLNRGRDAGIRPNMAVVTTRGLVGKTRAVTPGTCEVLLITDPNCRVACRLSRTGAFGIVRGEGVDTRGSGALELLSPARPARMEYIDKTREIMTGDEVVTSGLGGVFPEGLLLGHVVDARMDVSGLYQHAAVRPADDMISMKYVFVVVPEPSGQPATPDGPEAPAAGEPDREASGDAS